MQASTAHSSRLSARDGTARIGFHPVAALGRDDRDPGIASLVARAKAGDMGAVRLLYVRYKDNVYGYVLSIVGDQHEAEDVTQHVFLKLMSVIHKYEPRGTPFTAWLLRVARNAALDHLRSRRSLPCEEVYERADEADDSSRDRRWGLEQALGALPQEQRNVLVLRHLVGLTPAEIALRMGRTEASVHGLHHRGRKRMCRELVEVACAPTARATA
jgi:RNA polymerase sigma-70 factor (ECF subfamily)